MATTLVMIVGSPRLKRSTSYSIAYYLKNGLTAYDWTIEILFAHQAFDNETKMNELQEKTKNADIIGIIFPLYVDGIPGPLVHILEQLNTQEKKNTDQKIFTIVNSGFPEPHHSKLAVDMIEQFAREYSSQFIGGYTIGAGGVVGGMPIEQIKNRSKRLVTALDLTIKSLGKNQTLSDEAKQILSKPIFSKTLYNMFANLGWKPRAKKNGVKDLYLKPDKQE
jgi:NAD(P)H-dependent FMN reductase